ncbi:EutP/PduV family microcompartment system protein [Acetobacterium bakii]|uniref:Ethanolamine utilization protein EutP n=1 Tax=Acetobacterium bakii TaxID=52689 RepID=A0A0L6U3X6_9FIRM|nr:EutP/PduV family microcompartment system protein [Acetobacterium bakii]KNZ42485.1 ethanolamine utilization protein EutP [Acetobacterium bakii]
MKKVMFIGPSGSGKTTLYQRLGSYDIAYDKTQVIEFHNNIIDTPGEYLENRGYYSALQVTSVEADVVALVMDCKSRSNVFPPGFARMFIKPIIGIVTKIDLILDEKDYSYAEDSLRLSGVNEIFKISSLKNKKIAELRKFLEWS